MEEVTIPTWAEIVKAVRYVESAESSSGLVESGAPVTASDMEAVGGAPTPRTRYEGSAEPTRCSGGETSD